MLVTLAAAIIVLACRQEPDLHLAYTDKMPPSFSFSGKSIATNFEVLETSRSRPLSETKPYKIEGQTVWKISVTGGIRGDKWPAFTYGEVPNGFSQIVPVKGPPSKLVEGKLYVARIVADDYDSTLFFEVRDGRILNVTDKVFEP